MGLVLFFVFAAEVFFPRLFYFWASAGDSLEWKQSTIDMFFVWIRCGYGYLQEIWRTCWLLRNANKKFGKSELCFGQSGVLWFCPLETADVTCTCRHTSRSPKNAMVNNEIAMVHIISVRHEWWQLQWQVLFARSVFQNDLINLFWKILETVIFFGNQLHGYGQTIRNVFNFLDGFAGRNKWWWTTHL